MNTYCKIYKLRHDRVKDYIACHKQYGEGQAQVLKDAGAKSLEIYLWEDYSIITYECEDFDVFIQNLSSDERNARWQERVNDMFEEIPVLEGSDRLKPLEKIYSTNEF